MKKWLINLMNISLVFFTVMITMVVSIPQVKAADVGVVVDLVLLPPIQTAEMYDVFDITIEAQCNGQDVDGISAYLDFDPTYLEVKSVTPGAALPTVLENNYNNTAGTINYSAGKLGKPYPSGTFTVATVTFKKVAEVANTSIDFHTELPRETWAGYGGTPKLRDLTGAIVIFDNMEPTINNIVITNPSPLGSITVLADVTDSLSGVASVKCVYDSAEESMSISSGDTYGGTLPITEPELYNLYIKAIDNAGNTAYSETILLAVYDPSAGFVTGDGWIDLPAGAYVTNPSLTGKATFGFVSKYKKGANIPDGQTEFQFKAGNLNFHSTSYDWLVVTSSDFAKFKGKGTINGEGEYKFMLTACDKDPDTFRIRIWQGEDKDENIIYDNGVEQEIGGGSIVIHTGKK
jgi:hypothetical protein